MPSSYNNYESNNEYDNNDPMNYSADEEPSENESEDPSENELAEEPARIQPFTIVRRHPNGPFVVRGPRMSVRAPPTTPVFIPSNDPYQPPSPPTHQWEWLGAMVRRWKKEHNDPFDDVPETPNQAQTPSCPILGEQPHRTIPILVLRLDKQENEIDHLKDNLEALPPPEDFSDMQDDIKYLGQNFKKLKSEVHQLRNGVTGDPRLMTNAEKRVIEVENEMNKLTARLDAQERMIAYMLGA